MTIFSDKKRFVQLFCGISVVTLMACSSLVTVAAAIAGASAPTEIKVQATTEAPAPKKVVLDVNGNQKTMLFSGETVEELLRVSYQYLLITAVPGFLAGLMLTFQQLLRGAGDTAASMRGGVIQLLSKVAVIAVGAQVFRSLPVVWLAWPVSFSAAAIYLCWHMKKKSVLSAQ